MPTRPRSRTAADGSDAVNVCSHMTTTIHIRLAPGTVRASQLDVGKGPDGPRVISVMAGVIFCRPEYHFTYVIQSYRR
jgi:hypothetical protein